MPKDSVVRYDAAVKEGKFLVVAHGTVDEVARARTILVQLSPSIIARH